MNTWARKSFKVGVLSAGALLFAGSAANADFNSIGNSGILSGNQINAAIQAPIDICGNAIGAIGNAQAACAGGSWANLGDPGTFNSFGNSGIGSGNQINATIQAPIDVCGNAIGIIGNTGAACVGGSAAGAGANDSNRANHDWKNNDKNSHKNGQDGRMHTTHIRADKSTKKAANTESAHILEGAAVGGGAPNLTSLGNSGIASGNQINAALQLPIDVCGNAIGLVGNASASCVGGAAASNGGSGGDSSHGNSEGAPTLNSGFNSGILSGNQVNALLQVPIDVCGNAIGLIGNSQASCVGGSTANAGGGLFGGGMFDNRSAGMERSASTFSPEGGWDSNYGGDNGGNNGGNKHHRSPQASGGACSLTMNSIGNSGIGSGNQINLNAQAPIDISGNAIGLIGNAQAFSVGGAFANC